MADIAAGKAGRPPKFSDAEELREKIEEYFGEYCKGTPALDVNGNEAADKYGRTIYENWHRPTVTGLARYLGFKSRQALINYQGRKEFCDIITEAKMRIEEYAEERLYDRDGFNGARFNLINNFRGWSDKASSEDCDEAVIEKQENMLNAVKEAINGGN